MRSKQSSHLYFLNWCQGQTNFFYNIFSIKLYLQEIADFRFVRKESVAENRYFKKNILQSKQFEPLHQKPHISDREFVKLNKTFFCFFALPQMVLSELWNNFLRYRNNMINFFMSPVSSYSLQNCINRFQLRFPNEIENSLLFNFSEICSLK